MKTNLIKALWILKEAARQDRRIERLALTCGGCGWSWSVRRENNLLCGNPESPYFGDIVRPDLGCPEQRENPEEG